MEPSKPKVRSSSTKIDKIVCRLVYTTQDLSKAANRELKIADSEYFRALKGHISTRDTAKFDDFPYEIQNKIDKAVRTRLKEGQFGYDHSQLLALHLENNEKLELLDKNKVRKLSVMI